MKPIFETNYLGFWIKVFPSRVDFKSGPGEQSIPINQMSSVQLGMIGYMQIVLETTGGKKYKIPCLQKKEVREAIYKAQEQFSKSKTLPEASVADELLKLSKLNKQGIISDKELQEQKKKLLG
jgi:hypothetical protein